MGTVEQSEERKSGGPDGESGEELTDITTVRISGTGGEERLRCFLEQMRDPCCYRVGEIPVRISFSPGAAPLENVLKAHFIGLKQNGQEARKER